LQDWTQTKKIGTKTKKLAGDWHYIYTIPIFLSMNSYWYFAWWHYYCLFWLIIWIQELNTTEDFISLYVEVIPCTETLPLVLLHKESLISKLLSRLHIKARLSLEPILRYYACKSFWGSLRFASVGMFVCYMLSMNKSYYLYSCNWQYFVLNSVLQDNSGLCKFCYAIAAI
jgi:hypothetical protein